MTPGQKNQLHPKSVRRVLDSTEANKTVEQVKYMELFEEYMKKVKENKTYTPNPDTVTEFSEPLEKIFWISENIPKNKRFLQGLNNMMEHDITLQLLQRYGGFMH